MLVLSVLGAVERRRLLARSKRPAKAEPEPEPTPVTTTRVTLIDAAELPPGAEARWRDGVNVDEVVDDAIRVLNRAIHAQRTAAGDPYVREVSRPQALVVRMGVGTGDDVAHGRWTDAVTVPPVAERLIERRATTLRPQERLAAILGGRDAALAAEELTLRARADLDAGREREAALQVRVALEAALAELAPWRDKPNMAERLDRLAGERGPVGAAANAALQGGLDRETAADVDRAVRRLEATLRARTAAGLD